MSDIYVFSPTEDENDYSSMGLVGALTPSSCLFTEEANGDSSIKLVHPLDEFGRYTTLVAGNILVCPVPVRTTPIVNLDDHSIPSGETTVYGYKIKPLNQLTSKNQRTLWKKKTGTQKNRRKKIMPAGTEIIALTIPEDESQRWYVSTKYGKGYVEPSGLVADTTYIIGDNSNSIEEVLPPWTVRDQIFRIYEATRKMDGIEVHARHISYDLLYNMTSYRRGETTVLQEVLDGVLENCYGEHEFNAYTDVSSTKPAHYYNGLNPIKVFLDGEEGLCSEYGVSVVRDNYDLFFLNDPGLNRGVRVQYTKNLTGLQYKVSEDEVVTRIIPVGETKNGDPLYLSNNVRERYIDVATYFTEAYPDDPNTAAALIAKYTYPFHHIHELKCENCKVGEKDSGGGTITTEIARQRMRQQTMDLFATGCYMPTVEVTVDFINLGDTAEYSNYKGLENLYLYDYVIVQHPKLGVDITERVVGIEWNCLTDQMSKMTVSHVGRTLANTGIVSWQIPAGISGTKLLDESIPSKALVAEIISSKHMQAESVNAKAIQSHTITADQIAGHTITGDEIKGHSITADEIDAASVAAGIVDTQVLKAEVADIASAEIGRADIDYAQIKYLDSQRQTTEQFIAQDAVTKKYFIRDLQVSNAQMVEATVGNLVVKASNGNYYRLDFDEEGNLTPTNVTTRLSNEEIAAGETYDSEGRRTGSIIETDLTVDDLSASNLKAINALIDDLTVKRLYANQAFINELNTTLIKSDSVVNFIVRNTKIGSRNYLKNSKSLTDAVEGTAPTGIMPITGQAVTNLAVVGESWTAGSATISFPEKVTVYDGTQQTVLQIANGKNGAVKLTCLPYNEGASAAVSVWVKAESETQVRFHALGGYLNETVDTKWHRMEMIIDEPMGRDIEILPMDNTTIWLYEMMVEANATKVSDWVEAPEVIEGDVDGLKRDTESLLAVTSIRPDGVHILNASDNSSEVHIAPDSVNIRVGGKIGGKFASNYVQLATYRMYIANDNGLAFKVVENYGTNNQ